MRKPESVRSLENLGRVRLSPSFFSVTSCTAKSRISMASQIFRRSRTLLSRRAAGSAWSCLSRFKRPSAGLLSGLPTAHRR